MASTYSRDNVGAGVDSIVSLLVTHPVRYSTVSQTDSQLVIESDITQESKSVHRISDSQTE